MNTPGSVTRDCEAAQSGGRVVPVVGEVLNPRVRRVLESDRCGGAARVGAHLEVNRVAALLDMSPRWVKEQVKAGELLGYRLGNRTVVAVESLLRFMDRRRMSL